MAGEGPYLKVFEADTSTLIKQCRVFEGQTIHGIAASESHASEDALQIVIWGGSSLVILTKKDLYQFLRQESSSCQGSASSISDWILDVAISPDDNRSCVLVTAHNTVLRASLGNNALVSLEELHSPSRSILYSAHLIWDSPHEILVAAGTVFGEIITWTCSIPQDAAQSEGKVLFTFTGHEGSIFGVNISQPIARGESSTGRLLASCSDDRTIRVWDLSSISATGNSNYDVAPLRVTGFGNDEESPENKCVAVAMGHASRIWRVQFLVNKTQVPNSVHILSFGEDSTTQQWSLNFGPEAQNPKEPGKHLVSSHDAPSSNLQISGQLKNRKISSFHSGKHIWSAATRHNSDGRFSLATGGADGKISMYPVEMDDRRQNFSNAEDSTAKELAVDGFLHLSWSTDDVFELLSVTRFSEPLKTPANPEKPLLEVLGDRNSVATSVKKKKAKKAPKDSFSRYAFVSENQVVVTTAFGRILVVNFEELPTWDEWFLPEAGKHDLKSWSVVKSLPEAGLVYLAGTNGKIYASKSGSTLLEVGCVEGKVADIFVVSDATTNHSELLVTTLSGSYMDSFAIDRTSENLSFAFAERFSYELPPKFVVTSAGICSDFLVLGSRYGSLAIYSAEGQLVQLVDSHQSLNGDAITSIIPMAFDKRDRIYFLITGRKGAYLIFAFNPVRTVRWFPSVENLSLVHQGSPPFGPMIENAWFSSSDLILYGFKSKNFIVWNETQQYEIMSVECGGAHRSYAYSPSKEGGHFVYTKASKLYLHSQLNPSHKIIKSGGHGREIKACAVPEGQNFVATGAEDTAIRIWSYDDSGSLLKNNFRCLAVVQKHTAGIQHLQWHKSSYLFSSGGNEEFFIWAVESLPTSGIGIMCEATCPDQSEDQDLRIMGFDVTELPFTGEMKFLISLAYSDSTVRVYTYSKVQGYILIAKGRYTSSCLMQIRHLRVEDDGVFCILTAATDGNLALWKGSILLSGSEEKQELVMVSSRKVHQSSIKSLDIATTKSRRHILVVTGGDDNALAITVYEMANLTKQTKASRSFILRSAHSAAITGLTFIPSMGEDILPQSEEFRVVSSGNDQRVKEWSIKLTSREVEDSNVQIKKVGDSFTAVADVGDVCCLQSGGEGTGKKVLIVGNGMEAWRVCGDKKS